MPNAKTPMIPVPLDLIGGLYTEATPDSLPAGASPLCINDDFNVGSAVPRPGKQSAYIFDGIFVEKAATVGVDVPTLVGDTPWSSPNNISHDTPGIYASVTLSFGGSGSALGAFDKGSTVGAITPGGANDIPLGPLTPALTNEVAIILQYNASVAMPSPGTWTSIFSGDVQEAWLMNLADASTLNTTTHVIGMQSLATGLLLFFTANGTAALINHSHQAIVGGDVSVSVQFPSTVTPGNVLLAALIGRQPIPTGNVYAVSDNEPQNYIPLTFASSGGSFAGTVVSFGAIAKTATRPTVTITGLNTNFDTAVLVIGELTNVIIPPPTGAESQILQATNFRFNIPSVQAILGMQIIVSGHQSSNDPGSFLTVSLANPSATSPTFNVQLPASDGDAIAGAPTSNFGLDLEPALFNSPIFAVNVQAFASGVTTSFSIYAVSVKLYLSPVPAPDFNYIKTFSETGGEVLTLALGSDGVMYQENVETNPGVLDSVYTQVQPGSFAQSATQDDREFIAVSNLQHGTDIPLTYSPPNFDRLSQVGPGAAPSASTTAAGSLVLTISQNPKVVIPTSSGGTSGSWALWSASPQDQGTFGEPATPGNVFTWAFPRAFILPAYIQVGVNIVISGAQVMNGYDPNNGVGNNPPFYTITSIGQPIAGQDYYDGFTFTLPQTGFYNKRFQAGTAFESTIATMTTATQIPNLEVGNQFALSGTGGAPPSGYDSTWTVLTTPNAAQLQITSTRLQTNVAQYGYNLITGTAPVVGQFVTVTQTLNGNGVFNVTNAVISAASPGNFSVNIVSPNVVSSSELGSGIIFGTIFTFDAFTIVGNKSGGSIVTVGVIGSGIRKVCYSFLTRNGYLTQPSPILTFDVPAGASGIAIANLATGPSNVIARVIHLTAANGGNFYNIPVPVSVNSNGVVVISSSTWVNDNTTTNVVLSFSDGVLLAADAVDVEGNNLFETVELGSSVMLVPYGARMFAIGEQNKVANLLNYSFDGGTGVTQGNQSGGGGAGAGTVYPLGWTVDPANGAGVSVAVSPIFGTAFTITNATGMTQAVFGMITQDAFQDEFQVAIIEPSITYSVRITVASSRVSGGGSLVVDLFSPARGIAQGTFTLAISSILPSTNIFTGTLLTTSLSPVPNDLLLRIYAKNIPTGTELIIDRVEVFPTEAPNLDQQLTGSYVNNFEAFDQVAGVVGTAVQNQQPVRSAFVLFDSLYIVKTGSFISTVDNGTTQPLQWGTRTVSAAVGASGPYAVTTGIDEPNSGEEWAIVAGRPGAFIFNGGEPIKLSEEIQSLWNQINWTSGHTLWVKNDIINRRILIGCPMKTPNTWIPAGLVDVDTQNPTTPNVVLELNYKQLNTAAQLSDGAEVHRSYSGKLIASELVRKWSVWTIKAPCAAFVERPDGTAPIFLGNSDQTGKIYQLIDGLLEDDGDTFEQIYTTYGFVPSDQSQGMQMGVTRFVFKYMTMLIDGSGEIVITVMPNTVNSGFSHILLPNLTLPASSNGDVEIPLDEAGSRIYVQINAPSVGSGFILSRIVMVMRQDPWAPISGVNNV